MSRSRSRRGNRRAHVWCRLRTKICGAFSPSHSAVTRHRMARRFLPHFSLKVPGSLEGEVWPSVLARGARGILSPFVPALVERWSQQSFIDNSKLRHFCARSNWFLQGSGIYGSRARCDFWRRHLVACNFLTRLLRMKLSVIFLQSHQQHHAAPEAALTIGSMLLKRKLRHLPLFKIVDFA